MKVIEGGLSVEKSVANKLADAVARLNEAVKAAKTAGVSVHITTDSRSGTISATATVSLL